MILSWFVRSWQRKWANSKPESQNAHSVMAPDVMGQGTGEPHELCGIWRAELDGNPRAELDAAQLAELDVTHAELP